MNKSYHSEEYENQILITNREKLYQPCEEKTGIMSIRDPKVILCEVKTSENENNQKLACLINWDTTEKIDGYSVKELKELRQKLDETILRMAYEDPNQHFLFGD